MACSSETGAQLLARLGSRPDISEVEPILFPEGLKVKDVKELYGAEGCGKTEMMLHITCSLILPKTWRKWNCFGCGASVIFIDTDYKFSILRLVSLLEKRIANIVESSRLKPATLTDKKKLNIIEKPNCEDIEKLIKESLKKVYVLHCKSSSQLLATLHSLETVISSNQSISVIMIDSISAFYWLDRCNGGESVIAQEKNMNLIVDILTKLVKNYNLVLFASKSAIFKRKSKENVKRDNSAEDDTGHSEFLCRAWSRFVKERLVLKKESNILSKKDLCFTVCCLSGEKKFKISEHGIVFE